MSFERLPYDTCAYEQVLAETVGPGIYQLTTPPNSCQPCHPTDVRIRLQGQGASISRNNHLIDVDSDLMGITRNLSNCPERKYMPGLNASELCGAMTGSGIPCQKSAKVCIDHSKNPIKTDNCFSATTDTRLSNPPCTLRGTGWNRWEWLCRNPQDRVEIPYDYQIDTKLMSKDNHRPCVVVPQEQMVGHPEENDDLPDCDRKYNFCPVPTGPPSTTWQSLDVISRY